MTVTVIPDLIGDPESMYIDFRFPPKGTSYTVAARGNDKKMQGYSLKKFFSSPLPVKYLPYLLLLFAILGFFDATYLVIDHYRNITPPCTIHGCEIVLQSQYATLFRIPIAAFGSAFYLAIMLLTGIYLQTKQKIIATYLFSLSMLGFFAGGVLVYLQGFVIHSWCQYCLFSALMDFLIFDTAWWLWNSVMEKQSVS